MRRISANLRQVSTVNTPKLQFPADVLQLPDGKVVIADKLNHCVHVGAEKGPWTSVPDMGDPGVLLIMPGGDAVLVVDHASRELKLLTLATLAVEALPLPPAGLGVAPLHITSGATDATGLVVADKANKRLWRLTVTRDSAGHLAAQTAPIAMQLTSSR